MKFQSMKLTHNDGTMHHLGIDESMVAKRVILVTDPQAVPFYAALLQDAKKVGEYREYVTYTGLFHGEPLSVMSCGFGCMPMAIAVEELHHLGVEEIVKLDLCPAVQEELPVGSVVAASGAVRGEGATREYIHISYPAVADASLLGRLLRQGLDRTGLFRSHDCASLESPWYPGGAERIAHWAGLGVSVLDGETSALFVLGSLLGLRAASVALISENYVTGEKRPIGDEERQQLFRLAAQAQMHG